MTIAPFVLTVAALMAAAPSTAAYDYTVPGTISPLRQDRDTCWLAASTVIYNWKHRTAKTPLDIARLAGEPYLGHAQAGRAITPSEEAAYYPKIGMRSAPGVSMEVAGWVGKLKEHGPLSVTINTTRSDPGCEESHGVFHALVLYGVKGDGSTNGTDFRFIDTADGARHTLKFGEFVTLFENDPCYSVVFAHFP